MEKVTNFDKKDKAACKENDGPREGRDRLRKSIDRLEKTNVIKNRPGRPPKLGTDLKELPQKSHTESDEFESGSPKMEIKCLHCTKTFPSQSSLSTHIQHHNLENCLTKGGVCKRNSTDNPNGIWGFKIDCDLCDKKFLTYTGLFKHQVKVHGLETPDENVLAEPKKRLHTPKNPHSGIPIREEMRKPFANMKFELALLPTSKNVKT